MKVHSTFWLSPLAAMGFLLTLSTGCEKDAYDSNTVTDIDGNVYHTVAIGNQVWMVENLKTTHYNDGTAIPLVKENAAWGNLATPGYCWLENDSITNKAAYGALYNWYAVDTEILCPEGWHIPTDEDWSVLTTYLGGESVSGGKLKETGSAHWLFEYAGTDNSSSFTARPGGARNGDGTFGGIRIAGYWWTSTGFEASTAWYRQMSCYGNSVARGNNLQTYGYSVRCIRD